MTAPKRHAGRPTKKPGQKRLLLSTTVAPETLAAIEAAKQAGESAGQVVDRAIEALKTGKPE